MPTKVHLPDGRVVNFPDGMLPAQIQAEVEKLAPVESPAAPERSWTDTAVDALPDVGGAIGGLVGKVPVLGTALAGLAGAGGEGYRQTIEALRGNWATVPPTIRGRLRAMATAGAEQAGAESGGRVIGAGLQKLGHGLYRAALRPAAAVTREYGDVVGRGLAENIPVTAGGTIKARNLRMISSQKTSDMIAAAEQAGAQHIPTNTVVSGFKDVAGEAANRASLGMADDTADVAARARSIHRNNPGGSMTPTRAQELKKTAQAASDTAFRTEQRGGVVRTVDAQLDKATATGLKKGIETAVPGVREVNTRTQALGGLGDALETAEGRNYILERVLGPTAMGVGAGITTGDWKTGAGAAALTAGLTSPRALSGLAIGMNKAADYTIPQQLLRAALAQRLRDEQP